MADIRLHLSRIKTAVYGEDVRGSIHDAISAINDESSKAINDASAAKDSAKASAKAASDAATNALQSEKNAKEYADRVEERIISTNIMVGATADTNGQAGFVPSPLKGEQNKFLRGDGEWSDIVTHLRNIEAGADIKAEPAENDYIPLIDTADGNKMKKTPASNFIKEFGSGYAVKKDDEGYYIEV